MKTVKSFRELSVNEALDIPLRALQTTVMTFLNKESSSSYIGSYTGKLLSVSAKVGSPYPFRADNGVSYERVLVRQERYPNQTPEGVRALPHDFLAYISASELKCAVKYQYWAYWCGHGWGPGATGDGHLDHYAIDVRTDFAKVNYPELVEAMEYECVAKPGEVWRVGDAPVLVGDSDMTAFPHFNLKHNSVCGLSPSNRKISTANGHKFLANNLEAYYLRK
jgi:hypothetical protein